VLRHEASVRACAQLIRDEAQDRRGQTRKYHERVRLLRLCSGLPLTPRPDRASLAPAGSDPGAALRLVDIVGCCGIEQAGTPR
jgi:hypothetical protein